MKNLLVLLFALALLPMAAAQVSAPPSRTTAPAASSGPPASVQMAPAPDVGASLTRLNQVVEQSRVDLARMRVDKWKADSSIKRQSEANADSVQRNMTTALPAIVQQVRANPGSVAACFKLYRNLNALYDVMSSLAESAGAFGTKEEYQALANDTSNLDNLRRSLADQVEAMAGARDIEVAQLQSRARQAAAAAAAAPPKKVVIDDNEAEKKPVKRSTTKKKPAAASSSPPQTPPAKQ